MKLYQRFAMAMMMSLGFGMLAEHAMAYNPGPGWYCQKPDRRFLKYKDGRRVEQRGSEQVERETRYTEILACLVAGNVLDQEDAALAHQENLRARNEEMRAAIQHWNAVAQNPALYGPVDASERSSDLAKIESTYQNLRDKIGRATKIRD